MGFILEEVASSDDDQWERDLPRMFENEEECAKFINHKCVELGLEKRFPELDCLKPPEKKKSSEVY